MCVILRRSYICAPHHGFMKGKPAPHGRNGWYLYQTTEVTRFAPISNPNGSDQTYIETIQEDKGIYVDNDSPRRVELAGDRAAWEVHVPSIMRNAPTTLLVAGGPATPTSSKKIIPMNSHARPASAAAICLGTLSLLDGSNISTSSTLTKTVPTGLLT